MLLISDGDEDEFSRCFLFLDWKKMVLSDTSYITLGKDGLVRGFLYRVGKGRFNLKFLIPNWAREASASKAMKEGSPWGD